MKRFAVVLLVLALCCVAIIGAYAWSSRLEVTFTAESVPATENAELFSSLNVKDDINTCRFVTVRASFKSRTPFKTEWMTLSLNSMDGDIILVDSDAGPNEIDGFAEGTMFVTLLTRSPERFRAGRLEYYVFGRYHCSEITYGM